MSKKVSTAGIVLNLDTRTLLRKGLQINIRSKTLDLLCLLIDKAPQVVTKSEMLNTVWQDTVVEEQIIFQSIKELRKLFSGQNVIQTHPRKGYAWVAEVSQVNSTNESNVVEAVKKVNSVDTAPLAVTSKRLGMLLLPLILILIVWLGVFQANWGDDQPQIQGSVLVLPIKNTFDHSDSGWLRYGGMDMVIQQLVSTAEIGILQADYVIEVLNRAAQSGETTSKINTLFKVSGADLVVDISVSGNPGDYSFIYALYLSDQVKKFALVSADLEQGLLDIAEAIANRLGQPSPSGDTHYASGFSNELVAKAMNLIQSEQFPEAGIVLESAIISDPSNVVAHRLFVQNAISNNEFSAAKKVIEKALLIDNGVANNNELLRLHFFNAVVQVHYQQFEKAQASVARAKEMAYQVNDWLFLGYISELQGKLALNNGEFARAKEHFQQEISHHQVLKCPLGKSNGLFHLSQLAYFEGEITRAKKLANQSLELIQARKLEKRIPVLRDWIDKISDKSK